MPPIPRKKKEKVETSQLGPTVRLAAAGTFSNRNPQRLEKLEEQKQPIVRLAVTTALTTCTNQSSKIRYPFHKDSRAYKEEQEKEKVQSLAPNVRLAITIEGGKHTSPVGEEAMARHLGPTPIVRLAHVPGAQGDNNLMGRNGVERLPAEVRPALLVSYVYLGPFLANKHRYAYRDWVMDSGAFSAFASGTEINLQDYIDCCKKLLVEDSTLTEVFALDVIGDWKASVKNAEEMWRQGIPAIPCFHYGEPWELLKGLAKDYPKIALGGCVGRRDKDEFAAQCFARVWPCKIHGFGFGGEKSILGLPYHSVDATNWETGPCRYGRWNAFGGGNASAKTGRGLSLRGSAQNLRAEVEWYLELERKAREKWKKEMAKLEEIPRKYPSVRLVSVSEQGVEKDLNKSSFSASPTVRLVGNGEGVTNRQLKAFERGE